MDELIENLPFSVTLKFGKPIGYECKLRAKTQEELNRSTLYQVKWVEENLNLTLAGGKKHE
ncbi:MAG: hypothetical protein ACFFD2_00430 [Promethearchaeota archaeon]